MLPDPTKGVAAVRSTLSQRRAKLEIRMRERRNIQSAARGDAMADCLRKPCLVTANSPFANP